MKRLVRELRLGFIATVCADGTPNLSPKGTTTVWDDDHLVFAHLHSPNTVRNLVERPAIEINVVDVFTRKGYRFKGTGEVLDSGSTYDAIMAMYRGDSSSDRLRDADRRVKAIVLVKGERAEPLGSPAYDDGSTQDEVAEQWGSHYLGLRGLGVPSRDPRPGR